MLKECKVLLGLTLTVFLLFFTGCGDMFDFSTETPDTTKPSVTSQSPSDGAAVGTTVSASFSENVNMDGFSVSGVSGTTSGNGTGTISFIPSRRLDYGTKYTATISNVRDGAGNTLGNVSWSFTTTSPSFTVHTTPDWPNNIGQYNSVAISPADGRKYITYADSTANTLKIISTPDGTSWLGPTTIGTSPLGHSSMAIGSDGNVHVVYLQQGSPNNVIYTSSSSSPPWTPTPLTTTTATDIYADIAIEDTSNKVHVHISFYDLSNTALKYVTNKTGSWQTTVVDSGAAVDNPGYYTSIGVDGSGIVHISYYDQANANLKYAHPGTVVLTEPGCNSNWDCYTLDSTGDLGKYSSLALDSSGNVYITYYDATNSMIKLITDESGTFLSSTVVSGLSGETTCPLVIESSGIMHMSYISAGKLYYASKACSWSPSTVVDSGIGNGIYTSIAVYKGPTDNFYKAYISYYDATDQDLKYAHQTN